MNIAANFSSKILSILISFGTVKSFFVMKTYNTHKQPLQQNVNYIYM